MKNRLTAVLLCGLLGFTALPYYNNLESSNVLAAYESDWDYNYSEEYSGYVLNKYSPDKANNLEIPSEIDGKPVVGISGYCFDYCDISGKLTFPSTLIKVNQDALYNIAYNLDTIEFKSDRLIIAEGVFSEASNLEIIYPNGAKVSKDGKTYVDLEEFFKNEYGNNFNFTSVGDMPQEEPKKPELLGYSLSLDGRVVINIYMSEITDVSVQISDENGNFGEAVVLDNYVKSNNGYGYSYSIPPKNLSRKIKILYDGSEITTSGSAIAEETKKLHKNTEDIVNSLMKYCSAAEKYFSNQTVESDSEITADNLVQYKYVEPEVMPEGLEYVGSSLVLKSEISIKHYYKIDDAYSKSDFQIFEGKDGYEVSSSGELYAIKKNNICANELDVFETIMYDSYREMSYSALSYVYSVLSDKNGDENLKNLCKELYSYFLAAKSYKS